MSSFHSSIRSLVIVFILIFTSSYAQDVHFSQFNQTPQLLNPGATGVYNGYVRAILNYKNQWAAMGKAFNTVAASIDAPLLDVDRRKAHLGLGANFFSDKAGDAKLGITQFNLCLAGILPITRQSKISLGVSVGGAQVKADINALTWENQYDGTGFNTAVSSGELPQLNSAFYADLGAGLYYEFTNKRNSFSRKEEKRFGFGVSYFHLNQPEQKFLLVTDKLLGKLVVDFDAALDMGDSKISLLPSAIYFRQGKSSEATLGLAVRYRLRNGTKVTGFFSESGVSFGLHYRIKDAIIPQIYYEVKDFSFGLSYDINISTYDPTTKHNGGIEISLKYHLLKGALFKQKGKQEDNY